MRLIIDIPEEEYELIVNDEACGLHPLTRAIANGISLDNIMDEIEEERKGYPPSAENYKTINIVLRIIRKYNDRKRGING